MSDTVRVNLTSREIAAISAAILARVSLVAGLPEAAIEVYKSAVRKLQAALENAEDGPTVSTREIQTLRKFFPDASMNTLVDALFALKEIK